MNTCRAVFIFVILLLLVPAASALSGNWTQVNASAEFPERYQHTSVVHNNFLWVIGGFFDDSGPLLDFPYNDTWRSSDGNEWYLVNGSVAFTARAGHTSLVNNNRMWVIGGSDGTNILNDTWYSTDGDVWNQANASAQFPARYFHSSVVFGGRIWVAGGTPDGGNVLNDTWYSTDGDIWNQANASAQFPGRVWFTSLVYDNRMWVIGGSDGTNILNDTWYSTDGDVWNQANVSAQFPGRYGHTSVVYDDRMWVIGGMNSNGDALHDIWYSTDGEIWEEGHVDTIPKEHYLHSSAVFNSKIWMLGGSTNPAMSNDTWSFFPSPVASFTASPRSGYPPLEVTFTDTSYGYPATYAWTFGDGGTSTAANPVHTYAGAGTYTVSLTVTNSDGTHTETKASYIVVTNPPPPHIDDEGPPSHPGAPQQPVTVTVNVGGDTAVSRATVTGTGLSDLIVTGTVRSAPGSGIPPAPGIVYQYLDLVPARYTTITGSAFSFAVPEVWFEENGAGANTVALWHYTGSSWERRPTTLTNTANGRVEYSAEVADFSPFAIAAENEGLPAKPDVRPSPVDEIFLEDSDVPAHNAPGAAPSLSPPPQGEPVTGSPFGILAILAVCGIFLIAGVLLVRRWWIRRQNPALFRRYP